MRRVALAALAVAARGIEVVVDGRVEAYDGGPNATAALAFCATRGIDEPDRCAWELVKATGASTWDLVRFAFDTLPDAYARPSGRRPRGARRSSRCYAHGEDAARIPTPANIVVVPPSSSSGTRRRPPRTRKPRSS